MINELSVLIPCYNSKCKRLVESLVPLLEKERNDGSNLFRYEIIVADDGSTDNSCINHNKGINSLTNSRYIIRGFNAGRAAVRNFLASEAQYENCLFIDCDMVVISNDYIAKYLRLKDFSVVYGGYTVRGDAEALKGNLRYIYEKKSEPQHTIEIRKQFPYKDFHTSNFIVKRSIIRKHPLDERFRKYGYEDVLWGKTLRQNDIEIQHIDNSLSFEKFETNEQFIAKTEQGMQNLMTFREEMRGYNKAIDTVERLKKLNLHPLIRLFYKIFGNSIKHNLISNKPSIFLFKIYKIGYLSTIIK